MIPDVSSFKAKLEADLKKIRAEYAIHVSADVAQARADIDRFREGQQRNGMRVGVDVALAQAQADMEAFRARQRADHVTVKVDADTGNARREVDSLKKSLDFGGLKSAGLLNLGLVGIAELPAATTAIVQVAGALQQLAQAGLAIPGIMAGVGASVGTLVLGLSGISDAYDAVSKASQDSSQNQAQNAQQAISAANSHRNAVTQEAQAEKDRTRAWRDATTQLQDLNLQLRGGQISEEQAKNNALRQRRDLQKDLATGQIKDQIDLQGRLLDIQSADQSVAEAHQRNIELQSKTAEANQKGIANSDLVVAANERVVQSQQQVQSTQAALDQQSGGSTSQRAAAFAMSQLSTNGQELVRTLIDLKPQFQDFRNSISQPLLDGVSKSIKDLVAADLPNLKTGMGSIATAWNGTLKQLGVSLSSSSTRGLLDRILGNTADAQSRMTAVVDPMVRGLGTLTAAGTDALPRLVDDLGKMAERFANFIDAADKDGRLDKWINDGITGFEHVGNILLNLGKVFTDITGAAGGGDGLWGTLDKASEKLHNFLSSTEGQNKLKEWFAEGKRELHDLFGILQQLPPIAAAVFNAAKDAAGIWLPTIKDALATINAIPGGVQFVVDAFLAWKTITAVSDLLTSTRNLSTFLKVTLPADAAAGAAGMTSALGPVAALIAGIYAATHGHPENYVGMGPNSPGKAASQGDWGKALFGDAWGPLSKLLGLGDSGGPAATPPGNKPAPNDQKLHPGIIYRDQSGNVIDPSQLGPAQRQNPAIANAPLGPPITPPPAGRTIGDLKFGDPLPPHYVWDIPTKSVRGPDGHLLLDNTPLPPGFSKGGATSGPSSGYPAILHGTPGSPEFVQQSSAVGKYGIGFMSALNEGRIDPRVLPHFDGGGYIDQFGNPVTPGMIPGPSTVAPIAPNPSGGGALPAIQTAIGGLQTPLNNFTSSALSGVPGLSNISSLIPGLGGNQTGATGLTPGLAGLMQAGDDPSKQAAWNQQTTSFLGSWGGNLLAGLGTTFYQGILGFFGLQNSILSPSNPWFQDATKSLGIFNNLGIGGVPLGTPGLGTQSITLGDGSTIQIPTFGTSSGGTSGVPGLPTSVAPSGPGSNAAILAANQLAGKPYIAGGHVGPDGTDCSGLVSWIVNAYTGNPGSTNRMATPGEGPWLAAKGAVIVTDPSQVPPGVLAIGWNASHTAGTLPNGSNFESSTPGAPIVVGPSASGYRSKQFTNWAYFPGGASAPSAVSTPGQDVPQPFNPSDVPSASLYGPANTSPGLNNPPAPTHDAGGRLPPGVSLVHNATGGDEYVLNRPQASAAAHALQAQQILPTPPRPNFQVPDAKQMQPPPPAPAQIAPTPQPAAPEQGPPPPPAQVAPVTGPAPIGAGQSSDDHVLPAVSKGIQSGFAAAGNAVQAAAAAATFGAAGMGGGGMGGLSISGLFQQAGKIATNIANVGASMLVGSVPGSFGDPNLPAGGQTLRPAQNIPHTAALNGMGGTTNVFNGIDSRNVVDELRLKDAQDQQALLATSRG